MPSISTKWLYSICIFLAIILYLLTQNAGFPHPDSSYLNARYARNLVEGNGFVYNSDEKILLTWSPLIVLTHTAVSLPSGEVNNPPELLMFIIMGISVAALIRNFLHANLGLSWGIGAALIWVIFLLVVGVSFGGVEWWLVSFSLVAIDLAWSKNWQVAGIVAGLMVLISPVAIIFVILLGIQAIREKATYWRWVWWPALIWYGFAAWYFGQDGLQGLTLTSNTSVEISPIIFIVFSTVLVFWLYRNSVPYWLELLIIWSVSYSLLALLFGQSTLTLLTLSFIFAIAIRFKNQQKTVQLASALITVCLLILVITQRDTVTSPEDIKIEAQSVGHWGNHQEAFFLENTAYQLEGQHNPHLYELEHQATFQDILIATSPDILLPSDENFILQTDNQTQLLNYAQENDLWRRGAAVYDWQAPQEVNLDFGPDLLLKNVTLDRTRIQPEGIIRIRLDWELKNPYTPENEIIFILQLLNQQQVVSGAIQQDYPAERFSYQKMTTYHVLPVNADAALGLYDILLIVDYNGGILARQPIASVKIPAPTDQEFTEPALATFGKQAELMQVDIEQTAENLVVNLLWRAGEEKFAADYTVFVHLTPINEVQPVSQGDASPHYGTTLWEQGEVIEDSHIIPLQNVPSGEYVMRVGFFHPDLGRIPTSGGDSIIVGTVIIE